MSIFFFLLYFILLLLLTIRISTKNLPGISSKTISTAFAVKVLLGCAYGYVFMHYYGGDDTWIFFGDSLKEYQKMIHSPGQFVKDFSPVDEFTHHDFFHAFSFYLYDLEYWSTRKLLAVCNIFSQGNYYIDVLFFDWLIFWGPFLFVKLLVRHFPSRKKAIVLMLFFFPSAGFWLSGIRAEGLIFLFMAITVYNISEWFTRRRALALLYAVAGLAGVLVFRGVFLLVLIPALAAWLLTFISRRKPLAIFLTVYLVSGILFFGTTLVSSHNNLPAALVARQQEFFRLHGNTEFRLDSLQPTIASFLSVAPQAFANAFLRPSLWDASGVLQIAAALDVMVFWVFIFFLFFSPDKDRKMVLGRPILLLFLFYGFTLIFLMGFIVPFPGAMVRYKAIPEILFLTAILMGSRFPFK